MCLLNAVCFPSTHKYNGLFSTRRSFSCSLFYFFFFLCPSFKILALTSFCLDLLLILFTLISPSHFSSSFRRRLFASVFVISFVSTCPWMCTNITCKNNATSCSRIYYLRLRVCALSLSLSPSISVFLLLLELNKHIKRRERKKHQHQNRKFIFFRRVRDFSLRFMLLNRFWGSFL